MLVIPYCVEELVKAGIEVTIEKEKETETGLIGFNLNAGTKYGMFLYQDKINSNWYIIGIGKPGYHEKVNDLHDIMENFWKFYQMNGYGCDEWIKFLNDRGFILKKNGR